MSKQPETLQEAMVFFADEDNCLQTAIGLRWSDGVTCPHCGSKHVGFISTRKKWQCKGCRKQFSIKTGTVMEDSPLGLDKWMLATWMIANCKNGISSYELHRALGITQKTAWFLLHRIRYAMHQGSFEVSAEAEIDETYVGGKARFMHKERREKLGGRGTSGKAIVLGVLDRDKRKVQAKVIPNTDQQTLAKEVKKAVKPGAIVYTDAHSGYDELSKEGFIHEVINHAVKYVDGLTHTNGIENFWSLLKRCLKGTYCGRVEVFHLFRYIDEQSFRYDCCKRNDSERFVAAGRGFTGKRLSYRQLTGKVMKNVKISA